MTDSRKVPLQNALGVPLKACIEQISLSVNDETPLLSVVSTEDGVIDNPLTALPAVEPVSRTTVDRPASAVLMQRYEGASFLGTVCPSEVLAIIFRFLDADSLGRMSRVSKRYCLVHSSRSLTSFL